MPPRDPVIAAPAAPPVAAAIVPKDDILGLFRSEANQRSSRLDGLRVEDALAAFKTAGVEVTNVRQHLAKPFGADYCAGAEAGAGVVLSICEYRTPALAESGRTTSERSLASIPNRSVSVNGSTTLTLRERNRTPASTATAQKLERAFASVTK